MFYRLRIFRDTNLWILWIAPLMWELPFDHFQYCAQRLQIEYSERAFHATYLLNNVPRLLMIFGTFPFTTESATYSVLTCVYTTVLCILYTIFIICFVVRPVVPQSPPPQPILEASRDLEGECSICLELIQREEWSIQLRCLHLFHRVCLEEWLFHQITCPLCRIQVV